MALTTDLIEAAMNDNIAHPERTPAEGASVLAQAIVDTIKLANINYLGGLSDSVSGIVTGSLVTATLT